MVGHAWVGCLTPAEYLMEENPEGPDVGLDGVMPSGERLRGSPLVGDAVVVGEVDVLLQSDVCWAQVLGAAVPSPCRVDRLGEPGAWRASVQL